MAVPPNFVAGQVLTAAQMDKIAMWTVYPKTTFTSVSAITRDSIFTADYDNYMIDITFTKSVDLSISYQERVGGVTANTAYYNAGLACLFSANTVAYFPRSNNASSAQISPVGLVQGNVVRLFIANPFTTTQTQLAGYFGDLNFTTYFFGGGHNVATAYDGFTITTSAGTISGNYEIYGYNIL